MTLASGHGSRFIEPENLPPSPIYVFRGHVAEITALEFIRDDTRLVSGDTDGWIVVWNMVSHRPAAVWKGHNASVLSIRQWGRKSLITHGRDGRVVAWEVGEEDESALEHSLPAGGGNRRNPTVLTSIEVKDMTFCGIDVIPREDEALVAASSGNLGELIDIYSIPDNRIVCPAVGKDSPQKLGMAMCLCLASKSGDPSQQILAVGYESGHSCVYTLSSSSWSTIYSYKAHSQPVLSIAIHPSQESVYTSSADANLVQHPIAIAAQPIKSLNTKHSGQTSLRIRDDGRIFVTAGWDGFGRVYSSTTLKQVAVLKWHTGGLQVAGFSAVRRWIVLGGKDGKVTLWDLFN